MYPELQMSKTQMDGEPMSSMTTDTCVTEYIMALSMAEKELIWLYTVYF